MSTWRDVDYIESRTAVVGGAVSEVLDRARLVGVPATLLDEYMEAAKALTDVGRAIKRQASAITQNERGFRR